MHAPIDERRTPRGFIYQMLSGNSGVPEKIDYIGIICGSLLPLIPVLSNVEAQCQESVFHPGIRSEGGGCKEHGHGYLLLGDIARLSSGAAPQY